MSEQLDPPVIDCTLSEEHLNVLDFLFDNLPARADVRHAGDFEFLKRRAKNGVVRLEPHKDYNDTLVFTKYTGSAGLLGVYHGPLFVWRTVSGTISVDLNFFDSKGHDPDLIPSLRNLLDELMAPPARTDQVDMSIHYQAARNRIDGGVFEYLWQRKQFASFLHFGLGYITGVRENWSFIEFTLERDKGGEDVICERFAIGVMDLNLSSRGLTRHLPVRMFRADDVFMNGYQPIGLIDDPTVIPAIKARVDEIQNAMHRALLETDIL